MSPKAEPKKNPDTPSVETEAVTPLDANQEGSVHHTLAQLREARRFAGNPEEEPPTEAPEKPEEKPVGTEGPEAGEPPPEEPTETPSATPEVKFKYASHEEAEKAYREAERKMHQATAERAALQKELEALKERLAALEAERTAPSEKPETAVPKEKEEVVQRLIELNNQIDELDPYDPDYARQRAELELQKTFVLDAVKAHQAIPSPEKVKELVRQELEARQQQETQQKMLEDLERRAVSLAESYGLDMKPGSWDYKQFWRAVRAGDIPEGDLETQVKTLAQEILADRANFGKQAVQTMKRVHGDNTVLERGGSAPPAPKPEEYQPASIHDIIRANRRRI